jgi:tRNA dimethylallyltransferase
VAETPANTAVIAVVGPTAVGKTAVAEALAVAHAGEIVSADAMQVYRGMDIGTAKAPVADRRVPYHCIDLVEPGAPYSAALFQRDARAAIADITGRGAVPVLCGGTGMYVRAALDDWEFPPGDSATPLRMRLESLAADLGPEALHARLVEIDPSAAASIHPNNVRRVIRALEMAEGGVSYAEQASRFSARCSIYDTVFLGLTMERPLLYARIDARVDAMIASGLLGEVETLLAAGYGTALTATQAIGYKELVAVLTEGTPLDEAVDAIKRATRRYAKRQLTWFGADPRVSWLDVTALSSAESAARSLDLVESLVRSPRRP